MRIPILRLGNILLTSIQSDVDDEQALALQSDILNRLDQAQLSGVILDISSLDVVDSYLARVLAETAQMVRLMGGEVLITGMNPMVALTLIEMGREISSIPTALNLEQGVERMKERLAILAGEREGESDDGGR